MPKAEDQDYNDMEKETVLFHGKTGKVTWIEFEKSIARYFRTKFGSEIGNQLWRNELPIIDGDEAIDRAEFKEHCQEVLEAIANHSPQKVCDLQTSKFGLLGGCLAYKVEAKGMGSNDRRGVNEVSRASPAHH